MTETFCEKEMMQGVTGGYTQHQFHVSAIESRAERAK